MLLIAKELDELLAVNWIVMGVKMSLTMKSGHIDQVVGISNDTRNSAENVIVNFVKFSRFSCWHEKL